MAIKSFGDYHRVFGLTRYLSSYIKASYNYSENYTHCELPETVVKNVKNVMGQSGGASRGFYSVYTDIIHDLTRIGSQSNPHLESWLSKILTMSLSSSFLKGERAGLIVPIAYRLLIPSASKDSMIVAHRVGWIVELVRAYKALSDDFIYNDGSSHFLKTSHNLGSTALNDIFLLHNAITDLIHVDFSQKSTLHNHLCQTVSDEIKGFAIGRSLSFENHPGLSLNLKKTNLRHYKDILNMNVSNLNYVLPVRLALYLANVVQPEIHCFARKILQDCGYYKELQRDYFNCFLDPDGRDIQDGCLTWFLIIAYQRGNSFQKELLDECYGSKDPKHVSEIKNIYNDLNLKKNILTHIEENRIEIEKSLQQVAKFKTDDCSNHFFFNLLCSINIKI